MHETVVPCPRHRLKTFVCFQMNNHLTQANGEKRLFILARFYYL
jgi:hypothetical protein